MPKLKRKNSLRKGKKKLFPKQKNENGLFVP